GAARHGRLCTATAQRACRQGVTRSDRQKKENPAEAGFSMWLPSAPPLRGYALGEWLARDQKSIPPMPPMPPPMPPPPPWLWSSFFGSSATIASVVIARPATDEACCRAERVTLVGSRMPNSIMSPNSPVAAL